MTPEYFKDNESDPDFSKEAPGLYKISKENPFRVPDNYFDSLADNIQQKINALPDLERMNRENPFSVPDSYFETLPTAIQQRIIDGKNKRSVAAEWISIVLRPKYTLALATFIILLVFGIKYLTKPGSFESPDNFLSCEEVQNSSYFSDLDESILVDVLENEQTKNPGIREDNSMEQYLLDNDIDISQLENRL